MGDHTNNLHYCSMYNLKERLKQLLASVFLKGQLARSTLGSIGMGALFGVLINGLFFCTSRANAKDNVVALKPDVALQYFYLSLPSKFMSPGAPAARAQQFTAAYNLLISSYVYPLSMVERYNILVKLQHELTSSRQKPGTLTPKSSQHVLKDPFLQKALKALYSQLDPHTEWFDPIEAKALQDYIESEYKGLGLMLKQNFSKNKIEVAGVLDNTPASSVGVRAGDLLLCINGQPYSAKQFIEALEALKDKKIKQFVLKILRKGSIFTYTVKPVLIQLPTVSYKPLGQGYSYIRISNFGYHTAEEFSKIVKKYHLAESKGILLDLRNNPGGLLTQACAISDMLLSHEVILYVKGRSKEVSRAYFASKGTLIPKNVKVSVLVNNMTASAAEILSAALQQNQRAVVIGQRTFGKGSVQVALPVQDSGLAVITIALFYTPNGEALQGLGVIPDVELWGGEKNSFASIHESQFAQRLKVIHKLQKEPKKRLNVMVCKAMGNNKDREIGCGLAILGGKIAGIRTVHRETAGIQTRVN